MVLRCCDCGRVGRDRADIGGQRVEADPDPRLQHRDHDQPDHQRQRRDHLEIDQRPQTDPADVLHRAHVGDADHHRREDDRRNQHLHQLDEPVAERLHRRRVLGRDESEDHAEGDGRPAPGSTGSNRAAVLHTRNNSGEPWIPFVPRPMWRGGHKMTLFGWGEPPLLPAAAGAGVPLFRRRPGRRVLAHCHWQRRAMVAPDADFAARAERFERRALHAGHCRARPSPAA